MDNIFTLLVTLPIAAWLVALFCERRFKFRVPSGQRLFLAMLAAACMVCAQKPEARDGDRHAMTTLGGAGAGDGVIAGAGDGGVPYVPLVPYVPSGGVAAGGGRRGGEAPPLRVTGDVVVPPAGWAVMPAGGIVYGRWTRYGVSRDAFYLPMTNTFEFPVMGVPVTGVRVGSDEIGRASCRERV